MSRKVAKTTKNSKRSKSTGAVIENGADASNHEIVLKQILMVTLAIYILRTARKPISKVVQELMEVEIKTAEIVSQIMKLEKENPRIRNLRGVLAGAFSFIHLPMNGLAPIKSPPSLNLRPPRAQPDQRVRSTRRNRTSLPKSKR